MPKRGAIRNYHGDAVRRLFVGAAVVMCGGAPLYTTAPLVQLPLIVVGAIALVGIAACTGPYSPRVMVTNVVLSGAMAVLYQAWALFAARSGALLDFALRELPAVLLVLAFYFAARTLRAMFAGQLIEDSADMVEDTNVPESAPDPVAPVSAGENPYPWPTERKSEESAPPPVRRSRRRRDVPRDALGNPAPPPLDKLD